MCGICGYIGKSTNIDLTYELITQLFVKTEVRGKDASGFWGTEPDDGRIIYHKEPIKSSEFVKKKIWRNIKKINPDLLLVHARLASPGVGLPSVNKNNHPFVSEDGTIGLIHNGKVPYPEYTALKEDYEVRGACDSEMLLRLFEEEADKSTNGEAATRLEGVKKIWSFMGEGKMAVAIGERLDHGHRRLWFFRNNHRTLWMADLREVVGQVFFFSTVSIWHEAVHTCGEFFPYLMSMKLIELPTEQVWRMETSPEHPVVDDKNLHRTKVALSNHSKIWVPSGVRRPIRETTTVSEMITKLGKDEEPLKPKVGTRLNANANTSYYPSLAGGIPPKPNPHGSTSSKPESYPPQADDPGGDSELDSDAAWSNVYDPNRDTPVDDTELEELPLDDDDILVAQDQHEHLGSVDIPPFEHDPANHRECIATVNDICTQAKAKIGDIQTVTENLIMEGSISNSNFNDLMMTLEQFILELEGTLALLGKT